MAALYTEYLSASDVQALDAVISQNIVSESVLNLFFDIHFQAKLGTASFTEGVAATQPIQWDGNTIGEVVYDGAKTFNCSITDASRSIDGLYIQYNCPEAVAVDISSTSLAPDDQAAYILPSTPKLGSCVNFTGSELVDSVSTQILRVFSVGEPAVPSTSSLSVLISVPKTASSYFITQFDGVDTVRASNLRDDNNTCYCTSLVYIPGDEDYYVFAPDKSRHQLFDLMPRVLVPKVRLMKLFYIDAATVPANSNRLVKCSAPLAANERIQLVGYAGYDGGDTKYGDDLALHVSFKNAYEQSGKYVGEAVYQNIIPSGGAGMVPGRRCGIIIAYIRL